MLPPIDLHLWCHNRLPKNTCQLLWKLVALIHHLSLNSEKREESISRCNPTMDSTCAYNLLTTPNNIKQNTGANSWGLGISYNTLELGIFIPISNQVQPQLQEYYQHGSFFLSTHFKVNSEYYLIQRLYVTKKLGQSWVLEPLPKTFMRPMFNLQYHKRGEKEGRRVGGTEKRGRRKKGGRV